MKLTLTLPFPPSVNHYKKVGALVKTKNGKLYQRRVDTIQTKKFYFDVYMIYKSLNATEWLKIASSDNISFTLMVYLYPPNSLRYDIDNGLKVLFDSLTRAKIIKDDSQIYRLFVQKMHNIDNGKVIVKIIPLGDI